MGQLLDHRERYSIRWEGIMDKTESVRINRVLLERIKKLAVKNGRSVKMEMERMLNAQMKG